VGALPLWLAEAPTDLKRVVRRTGPGSFSIDIEPYRGSRTRLAFDRKLSAHQDAINKLEATIRRHQPELLGYLALPGQTQLIRDAKSLVTAWCLTTAKYISSATTQDAAIERLLAEVDAVLNTRRLEQTVTTALKGLQLPPEVHPLTLPNGLLLRALTDDELSDLASHDVIFGNRPDIISQSVGSCLSAVEDVPFEMQKENTPAVLPRTVAEKAQERVSSALSALHLTKEGGVRILSTVYSLKPEVFPNLGGQSQWPLLSPSFPLMVLTEADLKELAVVHERLLQSTRDEVNISANRLVEAENRFSPVDALLDATIGLEVLLNPMDSGELSFRVALNYALLGAPEERRARFDRLRSVQKVRNRVVHGGLNLTSPDASTIHEHAQLAKASLRDALKSFLFDPSLRGSRRLDAEFWLDRLLPPVPLLPSRG
jgi:hypothetical protein